MYRILLLCPLLLLGQVLRYRRIFRRVLLSSPLAQSLLESLVLSLPDSQNSPGLVTVAVALYSPLLQSLLPLQAQQQ